MCVNVHLETKNKRERELPLQHQKYKTECEWNMHKDYEQVLLIWTSAPISKDFGVS